jgi:hypothetical protein
MALLFTPLSNVHTSFKYMNLTTSKYSASNQQEPILSAWSFPTDQKQTRVWYLVIARHGVV